MARGRLNLSKSFSCTRHTTGHVTTVCETNRLDVDVTVVQRVHVFVQGVDVDKPMGEIKMNASPQRDNLFVEQHFYFKKMSDYNGYVHIGVKWDLEAAICTIASLLVHYQCPPNCSRDVGGTGK